MSEIITFNPNFSNPHNFASFGSLFDDLFNTSWPSMSSKHQINRTCPPAERQENSDGSLSISMALAGIAKEE